MAKYLILIHGLGGKSDQTWGNFPQYLMHDESIKYEVIEYGYNSPHPILEFWKRAESLVNVSNGLLTDIKSRCDLENDEIILVAHSMGGIILKKLLLKIDTLGLPNKIKKICFFDVPHDGSGYANVGKYLAFKNRQIKNLVRDSSELDDLNDEWVSRGFNDKYDILSVIASNDDIVSASSSKSIFREHKVETIQGVNHKSITKPNSSNDTQVVVLIKFILKLNTLSNYKSKNAIDYDWWITIEREHNLDFVADKQREIDLNTLKTVLDSEKPLVRLTGLSGLGKTRLILEYINNEEIINNHILIIDSSYDEKDTLDLLKKANDEEAHGLVVLENCSLSLHEKLESFVRRENKFLKIITTDHYHNSVKDSEHVKLSKLSDDKISQLIKSINPEIRDMDLEKLVGFVEGFPLLADMIAKQLMKDGNLAKGFSDNQLVETLINADNALSSNGRELLRVLSLFDYFPYESSGNEKIKKAIKFLYEFSKCDDKIFGEIINKFADREIINRDRRFARIVPKPLALNLAISWWNNNIYDRQEELIKGIPEEIFESFCNQIRYLDSSKNCKDFVKNFLDTKAPFIQAGLLFSEKGSRLFRALVEVNPIETNKALYRELKKLNSNQITQISDDVRRNLVVSLEMLVYHSKCFEKSAWSLFLLALNENESWSNNATGLFKQLHRVTLSGTEAIPEQRFKVLNRIMNLKNEAADMILLEALGESIDTFGGSRTIGAEHQGTKETLEEWKPKIWQDVYDYWDESFKFLLHVFQRGDKQKQKVMKLIGQSIRGFVRSGRIDMLDHAIKYIVEKNGPYWPDALESIQNTLEFDTDNMPQEGINALHRWTELLRPDNATLEEQLKIIVIDPPWNHSKDEQDQLIDVSKNNAEEFAREVSNQWMSLKPFFPILLTGEQRQTFSFAVSLASNLEINDLMALLDQVLCEVTKIVSPNLSFLAGLFKGLFIKDLQRWNTKLDELLSNEETIRLYPDLITTGEITTVHLGVLIDLIQNNKINSEQVIQLSYGSVTEHLRPSELVVFCTSLAEIDDSCIWPSLNIMYMYYFGEKAHYDQIKPALKKLSLSASLNPDKKNSPRDSYQWKGIVEKLLDDNDDEFAKSLAKQIVDATKKEIDYSDMSNYIKPIIFKLFENYGEKVWPIIGDSVINAEGMQLHRLKSLLDKQGKFRNKKPSALNLVPSKIIIDWCNINLEKGPEFIATCVNIFEITEDKTKESQDQVESKKTTDLFISLLENFGEDKKVQGALFSNIISRGWSGSLIPYLEADKIALQPLTEHPNESVRNWVDDCIEMLNDLIKKEKESEDEEDFGIY